MNVSENQVGVMNESLTGRNRYLVIAFMIAIFSSVMIWGSWDAPFFGLDDEQYIARNPQLKSDAPWSDLLRFQKGQNFYYPVTVISWRIDRFLWEDVLGAVVGPNAWATGIRIGNVVFHLLAGVLLWRILALLLVPRAIALFVVLGFSVHPYATEMLAWPIERKSILAVLFGFGAFECYLRARSLRGHLIAAVCYGFALMAKPSALGVFAMVGVWEAMGRPYFTNREVGLDQQDALARAVESNERAEVLGWRGWIRLRSPGLLMWFGLSVAGVAIGFYTHRVNVLAPPGGSIWTAMLTDIVVFKKYFVGLLLPTNLSAYYFVRPISSLSALNFWWALGCVGSLVGVTFWLAKGRRRFMAFVWLWFLGALGPHLNLVAVNDLMHDRFIYFSVPAFWLALGVAFYSAKSGELIRRRTDLQRVAWAGLFLVVLFWAYLGFHSGERYADMEDVMQQAKKQEPHSSYAHLLYGNALNNKFVRAPSKRSRQERMAIRIKMLTAYQVGVACPDYDRYIFKLQAHQTLAYLYFTVGRMADAREQALLAFSRYRESNHARKKDFASKAMQILGQIALHEGVWREALTQFDIALKLTPAKEILYFYKGCAMYELYLKAKLEVDVEAMEKLRLGCVASLRKVSVKNSVYGEAKKLIWRIRN